MNTNSTPVGFPVWHDGVIIYEPTDPKTKTDHPITSNQDHNASDSATSAASPRPASPSQPPSNEQAGPTPTVRQLNPPEPKSKARASTSAASIPRLKTPPERHTRKCSICNHEDRESIEEAYLNWTSPEVIARQYSGVNYWAVYRHAEVVGLPALRRRQRLAALDLIIEQAGKIRVTGSDVIRAIITSARIGDDGEYIEPVRRTQIIHTTTSEEPISNRKPKLLETP